MNGWCGRGLISLLVTLPLMTAPAAASAPQAHTGWAALDHGLALVAFRASCKNAATRLAPRYRQAFMALCSAAHQTSPEAARGFFEAGFCLLPPVEGLATGYYEPVIEGRMRSGPGFDTPLRAAPPNLVPLNGAGQEGALAGMTHALKVDGRLRPLPPRAAIEAGALGHLAPPLLYVDRVEAFFAHIQGSVAVRLGDGRIARLGYAGKNGHPYTAIGKVLVERGAMRLEEVSMESLKGWLRRHPGEAQALMGHNASYIFFAIDSAADPGLGPKGALGVPLMPMVSAAVDPAHHPLGLPLIVTGAFEDGRSAQLMVAQDVGSAIRQPGRIDIFTGSGAAAGQMAGGLKRAIGVHQLLPRFMCGGE